MAIVLRHTSECRQHRKKQDLQVMIRKDLLHHYLADNSWKHTVTNRSCLYFESTCTAMITRGVSLSFILILEKVSSMKNIMIILLIPSGISCLVARYFHDYESKAKTEKLIRPRKSFIKAFCIRLSPRLSQAGKSATW